jgi:phosphoribosylformylglycinamidine synthase
MAACGEPGEDAALYDTVKAVAMELCPALGVSVPVGKDSAVDAHPMAETDGEQRRGKKVTAPVSLIVTAFATLADVRGTLTPQLARARPARRHHAGAGRPGPGPATAWAAASWRSAGPAGWATVPDDDPAQAAGSLVAAVNELRAQGSLLAYHDRSDGGLWAAVCEMAFAGHWA